MNYDDDSDLTDLDSSDEYGATNGGASGTGTAKKSTLRTKTSSGAYSIRNTLKAPRATTYTAQALYESIHNQDVDLEAEYQREIVWPDVKQISLIDSIYRNFYVPPVIFAAKTHEDGSETKVCIDGKQRLTSIRRFMDGLIPHKDPVTSEKWWYKDMPADKKPRKILPDKLRRVFANKQIVCVEYQDITDDDEREIFQRVQLGMALTPAEKLQVINTPRAAFIRQLQLEHVKEGGLASSSLDWESSRGADFRCLAQSIWCLERHSSFSSTSTKSRSRASLKNAGTIIQLERWLSDSTPLTPHLRAHAEDTFRLFSKLVNDPVLGRVFKNPAKVSPVEFILMCLLIGALKDRMSLRRLSSAIGEMRRDVRAKHVDIRMNNRVAKTMIDFVDDLLDETAVGVGEEMVASKTLRGTTDGSKAKAVAKRKRKGAAGAESDDEDDSEDEPLKHKPKKTAATAQPPPLPTNAAKSSSKSTSAGAKVRVKAEPSGTPLPARSSFSSSAGSTSASASAKSTPAPSARNTNGSSRLAGLRAAKSGYASLPARPTPTQTPVQGQGQGPQHYQGQEKGQAAAAPDLTFTFPSSLAGLVAGSSGAGSGTGWGSSGLGSAGAALGATQGQGSGSGGGWEHSTQQGQMQMLGQGYPYPASRSGPTSYPSSHPPLPSAPPPMPSRSTASTAVSASTPLPTPTHTPMPTGGGGGGGGNGGGNYTQRPGDSGWGTRR